MTTKRVSSKAMNKEQIIAFLRENKKDLKKRFGVTKIALFGSYARDEAKRNSDIDLLIETKVHDFDNRYALEEYLEGVFKKKVDVLYFSAMRKFIMQEIAKDIIYA
jgi:predicted nucleotidyltransferase